MRKKTNKRLLLQSYQQDISRIATDEKVEQPTGLPARLSVTGHTFSGVEGGGKDYPRRYKIAPPRRILFASRSLDTPVTYIQGRLKLVNSSRRQNFSLHQS